MKRFLSLLLLFFFLLTACGNVQSPVSPALSDVPEETPAPTPPASVPVRTPAVEETASHSPEPDWRASYQPVFDCYASLLDALDKDAYDFEDLTYDLTPNIELLTYSKARLGYCLQDLDGDAVPELLTGLMTDDYYYSNIALSLFTLKEGQPEMIFASMARSRYEYFSEGGFLYEGSGGAAYYDVFVCHYSDAGIFEEYGAFHEGDRGFFLVTAGGKSTGILTDISEGSFYEYVDRLNQMIGSAPILTMMEIYEG